jgi:hypothetical protein
MNWKRGFFRIWAILSLAWIALIGLGFGVRVTEVFDPMRGPVEYHIPNGALGVTIGNSNIFLAPEASTDPYFFFIVAGPPVGLLVIAYVIAWAFAGFRRT